MPLQISPFKNTAKWRVKTKIDPINIGTSAAFKDWHILADYKYWYINSFFVGSRRLNCMERFLKNQAKRLFFRLNIDLTDIAFFLEYKKLL